ncbi:hypothetical protein NE619_02850 [Anaerovorax odorimutans]|uniref:Uncharacterized protein n=1 Tax=Anaerovorax odorimutans TaxID=109327 RepID=A0ABT1RKG2_9FIRM|nr:hypothetical protein [Anaerovorax odorimutans]MCQ4635655.1 hypothetical protein [Anaerovorax odorimutans]
MTSVRVGRFKNDNPGNPSNVISHMLHETEKQIEKMTGQKVKLIAKDVEE